MAELLSTYGFAQVILLGAFALSLVLTSRCAMQMITGSHRTRPWVDAVFNLAALVIIGILSMDGVQLVHKLTAVDLEPIPSAALIGLAAATALLHFRLGSLRLPAHEMLVQPLAWALLAGWLSVTCWSASRFYESGAPVADSFAPSLNQPRLEADPEFVGISDCGRAIPLFRVDPSSLPFVIERLPTSRQPMRVVNTIGRAERDVHSNCHGWVFTGGRFLLSPVGVAMLLEDNGYESCSDPRAGDIIIYRVGDGRIVHTGLVSGLLHDGTVLIESKWELGGRYLHRPEDQPYSSHFTYYRSSRASHVITIRQQRAQAQSPMTAGGHS